MDTLVVQTGIKHGRVAELTRSVNGRLTVGRGFDNDLVLTDVHVAPRQLVLRLVADQWVMAVLDDTNPVQLNDQPVSGDSVAVNSGDTISVGRMRLTVYSTAHPVERTRKLVLSNWLSRDAKNPLTPVLLLLALVALDLVLNFYHASTDLAWDSFAYSALFGAVIVVLWAGLWSLAGRIFRHQPHFGLQLTAAAFAFFLATVLSIAASYIAYPFHDALVTEVSDWAAFFIVLWVLFRLNLLIATNIQRTTLAAAVMSAVVIAVSYGLINLGEAEDFAYFPEFSGTLKPPFANIGPGTEPDEYFARVAAGARALQAE